MYSSQKLQSSTLRATRFGLFAHKAAIVQPDRTKHPRNRESRAATLLHQAEERGKADALTTAWCSHNSPLCLRVRWQVAEAVKGSATAGGAA